MPVGEGKVPKIVYHYIIKISSVEVEEWGKKTQPTKLYRMKSILRRREEASHTVLTGFPAPSIGKSTSASTTGTDAILEENLGTRRRGEPELGSIQEHGLYNNLGTHRRSMEYGRWACISMPHPSCTTAGSQHKIGGCACSWRGMSHTLMAAYW
jgi:hypothetical protein